MNPPALAALASAVLAALLVRAVAPPPSRLARRVRPYTTLARASLGRAVDTDVVAGRHDAGVLRRLLAPVLEPAADRLGRWLDGRGDDVLALRLRQAGLFTDLPGATAVVEYRIRTLLALAAGAAVGGVLAAAIGQAAPGTVALALCGAVAGGARWRGVLDRQLEDRRERMRIELYTANQLLAMHLRTGGGIVQATRRLVERGNGLVVDELAAVLRMHASGVSTREAFTRVAETTPEPTAARTYRLLAAGVEHGADLADALLHHADDIRQTRREALRRQATRRRAGMLLPIVGVLAPVMLLFIAAPIPSIVFGVP